MAQTAGTPQKTEEAASARRAGPAAQGKIFLSAEKGLFYVLRKQQQRFLDHHPDHHPVRLRRLERLRLRQ